MTEAGWQVAIDIGNTAIKLGLFSTVAPGSDADATGLPEPQRILRLAADQAAWEPLLDWLPEDDGGIVQAVSVNRPTSQRFAAWLQTARPKLTLRFLRRHDFAIPLDVEQPDRVGLDRIAGGYGAKLLKSAKNPAIVVDAGSAITVDLVSADGVFLGGAIMPGWQMMARALADTADLLPRVTNLSDHALPDPLGRSTEAAIRSGVCWGGIGAVRELVSRIGQTQSGSPELFLAGGDLVLLADHLPGAVLEPHLILKAIAVPQPR